MKKTYYLDCVRVVLYNARAARRGNPAARDGIYNMLKKPLISKAVTALVVVEVILSIIYLTRELLR